MKKSVKRRIKFFFVMNIVIVTASIVYNILFNRGIIGSCAFLSAFGFYCPGCGGSRSLNALLHLDFLNSFIYYPPIIITALIILYVDIRIIISIIKNEDSVGKIGYKIFLIIPITIILQFAVKNILLLCGIDILGNVIK